MAKVVRLTESDLARLVNKVIKEQYFSDISDLPESQKKHEKNMVYLERANARSLDRVIPKLPKNLKFISFKDCQFADFSNINLCEFPDLVTVYLKDTPNNLEETQGDCFKKGIDALYYFDIEQDEN